MAKHRIGIIGHTGRGDYGHGIDTVWKTISDVEIVGLADGNEAGLSKAAERNGTSATFTDYRKMLDETKPTIVSICPRWVDQHRDMVVAAAERGIHIYMEKPLCRTLAEADEMVAACEKHKVKLAIAHQTRYSPKLEAVRKLIAEGGIGELVEIRGRGKEDGRGGGEDLWVLGSHIFNLIHHFGGEPNWCFAQMLQDGQPVTKAHVKEGNEGLGPLAGNNISAIYGLDHGVTATFGSRHKGGPKGGAGGRFGLQLYGTAGVIDIISGYMAPVFYLPHPLWSNARNTAKWADVSSAGVGQPEPVKQGGNEVGNTIACNDLIKAIADDRQPLCNIYEARTTIEMIAAVFDSHRTRGPVNFPLTNRENALGML